MTSFTLLKWRIQDRFYSWKSRLFHQNKWLIKKIPRSWRDKDWLIEELVFACLVDFVEQENGLDSVYKPGFQDFNHFNDPAAEEQKVKHVRKDLEQFYDYIKTQRPKLQEEAHNDPGFTTNERLTEMDDWCLEGIIKLRGHLWT